MTLIAAFRTEEGVVICADSQETLKLPMPDDDYAQYRVSVDKIEPQQVGNYDLVIGGAGHGPLVEGFTEALADQVETWDAGLDGKGLKAKIRDVVLDYSTHEVAACQAHDKEIHFIVCMKQAKDPNAEIHLWTIRETAIKRVEDYALIGWEEGIYTHDVQRHYRAGQKSLYSMLVGVHVLKLAIGTSNNVGGPIKIIIAAPTGFRAIADDDATELEKRVADFDLRLDALRLRVSDTTIPLDSFHQDLSDFQTATLHLRLALTETILLTKYHRLKTVKTVEDLPSFDDPYLGLPALEESARALSAAWDFVTKNRRTKRDLAIASYYLSQVANLMSDLISRTHEEGVTSRAQARAFMERLSEINKAGMAQLKEHRAKVPADPNPVPDELVTALYSQLTERVVYPLATLANEIFALVVAPSDERAHKLARELYSWFLSLFAMALFSPSSKEPETLPEAPKQLESDTLESGNEKAKSTESQ